MNWLRRLFCRPRKTGAILQPKDSRDLKLSEEIPVSSFEPKSIPSLYDWGAPPNQKSTNACVGFSIARLVEILIYQVVKAETGDDWYESISEQFTWYLAREMQGWEEQNTGVYPRDAFKALFKYGYLPSEEMPFDNNPLTKPDEFDYYVASVARDLLVNMKFKYYAVGKSDALKLSNNGQAVAVSLPMSNSWYKRYADDDKPTSNYHYMVLEGTIKKDGIDYCKFANWWGKGYLYVPKSYYMSYARDLWTLARK